MTYRFNFTDLKQLQKICQEKKLDLGFSEEYHHLRKALLIGKKRIPNRIVIQPMEGFDSDDHGAPQDLTLRRYQRYALGGAGLIWFEAVAVLAEGRTNPHQLVLNEDNLPQFKKLVNLTKDSAVKEWGNDHQPFTVLQLTHSGRFSKPTGQKKPIIAVHDPLFDKIVNIDEDYPIVSDQHLELIQNKFVSCAQLAAEAGFDAVDIKVCHRYLISELLGAKKRAGKYGGSYENRTRFLKETLAQIKKEVPNLTLAVRLNASDLVFSESSWGTSKESSGTVKIDLSETKRLVHELKETGVSILNITAGTPYLNPHINRPYDQATRNGYPQPEHPLIGVSRLFNLAAEVQKEVSDVFVVGTGYSWLRQFGPAAAAWNLKQNKHALIGFGRQGFAYPDLAKDLFQQGQLAEKKCCITCSKCSQLMIWGSKTGCVARDELYTTIYRELLSKNN